MTKAQLLMLWDSMAWQEARRLVGPLGIAESRLVFRGADQSRRVLKGDVWVEVPLNAEWRAAARLVAQDGQMVLAEVRVFPLEPGPRSLLGGHWSAELLGARASVPAGGLTARTLRSVRLGEYQKQFRQILAWLRERYGRKLFEQDAIQALGLTPPDEARPRPARRAGRPDRFYAGLAAQYVAMVERGSRRPVAEIAARRGLPAARVRDMLHEARERKLLTPGFPGKSAGALMPRAEGLVKGTEKRHHTRWRGPQ
jgi:hypothetical protein